VCLYVWNQGEGEGLLHPPLPLPLAGSATINEKTTVHCSPGLSMDECCDLGIESDALTSQKDLFHAMLDLIRVSSVVVSLFFPFYVWQVDAMPLLNSGMTWMWGQHRDDSKKSLVFNN
jgi:hypothetical protein